MDGTNAICQNSKATTLARFILNRRWNPKEGGLVFFRGTPWEWYGGRWHPKDLSWLRRTVWQESETIVTPTQEGGESAWAATGQRIKDVVEAIESLRTLPVSSSPVWMGPKEEHPCPTWDSRWVVRCSGDLWMGREHVPADHRWFDPVDTGVTPDFEEGACPTWMKCLEEWSCGDEKWVELLQRVMGYSLVSYRECGRWFLMYGKVRAGKGVITKVLGRLLGRACVGMSLRDLTRNFSVPCLEVARVACVHEVNSLDGRVGEEAARVIKNLIGRDEMQIDRKYRDPFTVRLDALPLLVGNEVPTLSDKGLGLSSKMVVLPFLRSWLGKEKYDLEERLQEEMSGVLGWCLEGVEKVRKAVEEGGEVFPQLETGAKVQEMMVSENRPLEEFLEDEFVQEKGGCVTSAVLWAKWLKWIGTRGNEVLSRQVSKVNLTNRLREGTGWELRPIRIGKSQARALQGLRPKTVAEAEDGWGAADDGPDEE